MVWADIMHPQYECNFGRYVSDCKDVEWVLIEPLGQRSNGVRTPPLFVTCEMNPVYAGDDGG